MGSIKKSSVFDFIKRVREEARLKPEPTIVKSANYERTFVAYDWGGDTFVFEKGVWRNLNKHLPVLITRKRDLMRGVHGYIMTLTTGNHATAAIPLLTGHFWNLGRVQPLRRSKILQENIVTANVIEGQIEISQRDVDTTIVTQADEWLQSLGFGLHDVIMAERNDAALEFYRQQGQEWRIKPLAWTLSEMESALHASRTRIDSCLHYYHSVKGVHFLAYTGFHALLDLILNDYPAFLLALQELVAVADSAGNSFTRMPKYHGHNEVELFGLRRGVAAERIIPELERLLEDITLQRLDTPSVWGRFEAIDKLYRSHLERMVFVDEHNNEFVETMYMHLTGEIYHGQGASILPAFDDRRTALPGATFRGGRPDFHPGADDRTQAILNNVTHMISQDETIEYANIYEVRSESDFTNNLAVGAGATRELVFKTNRRPLCTSLIEKRLALRTQGYGSYMLARVEAFKALGVGFGEYRLLSQLDNRAGRQINYFIRNRCPGEPLDDIPPSIFKRAGDLSAEGDDPEVVLKVGELLGDAAAQNLVLKKYLPGQHDCRFGVGKEIFEFGYDIAARREMPLNVKLCSIRGCFGWEDLTCSEQNLRKIFDFYLPVYAAVLFNFWLKHQDTVQLKELTTRFFDGFEFKTREMYWNYSVRREQFDSFDPHLPRQYDFTKKWRFALWSLARQLERIDDLRNYFGQKMLFEWQNHHTTDKK